MNHTPGPWVVNLSKAWVEVPDRDAPICAMLWPTDLRTEEETMANAFLVSISPAMFEALRAITTAPDQAALEQAIADGRRLITAANTAN